MWLTSATMRSREQAKRIKSMNPAGVSKLKSNFGHSYIKLRSSLGQHVSKHTGSISICRQTTKRFKPTDRFAVGKAQKGV